jgi:hypothetical protein
VIWERQTAYIPGMLRRHAPRFDDGFDDGGTPTWRAQIMLAALFGYAVPFAILIGGILALALIDLITG